MNNITWTYANPENTVVWRELPNGSQESHLVTVDVIQNWLAEGNTSEPYVAPPSPPEPTPQEKLANAGLTVDELKTLLGLK